MDSREHDWQRDEPDPGELREEDVTLGDRLDDRVEEGEDLPAGPDDDDDH